MFDEKVLHIESLDNFYVTINEKEYEGREMIIYHNGNVLINGSSVDNCIINNELTVNVVVHGDVEKVQSTNGNIDVMKNVTLSASTTNGDINVQGSVGGNVSTVNGDIKCGTVTGSVKTVNGDIKKLRS